MCKGADGRLRLRRSGIAFSGSGAGSGAWRGEQMWAGGEDVGSGEAALGRGKEGRGGERAG